MRFLLKTVSKKTVAIICTVCLLLSVMSVCFGAFANTAVYTVDDAKPAIPVTTGKEVDLSKIAVELGGSTYNGADLTWSTTDKTGSVIVNDSAKKIIYLGTDICAVTAKNGTDEKTIYLVQPDANGEVILYDHTFSSSDISNYDFKEDSEWQRWYVPGSITPQEASFGIQFYYNNTLTNSDGKVISSAMYYIKPESVAGNLISAFPDLTVESVSVARGNPNWSGVAFRIDTTNWSKQSIASGTDLVYTAATVYPRTEAQTVASVSAPYVNGTKGTDVNLSTAGTSSIYKYVSGTYTVTDTYTKPSGVSYALYFHKTRVTAVGDKVTVQYTNSKDAAGTVEPVSSNPVTHTLSGADITGGTVGVVIYGDSRNIGLHSFKALITFTADELVGMKDAAQGGYLSDASIVLIPASKPALPMERFDKMNLSEMYFQLDDGSVVAGGDITWSTEDTTGNILVDDTAKTITLLGTDMYKVKAQVGTGTPKTIYVFTPDSNNQKVLIDYTFSDADAGTADANGVYTFGGEDNKLFKFYTSANQAVYYSYVNGGSSGSNGTYWSNANKGLNVGTATGYLVINPDSEAGKIMADFADYTITYRAAPHPNWGGMNKTSRVLGRYQMDGTAPNFANDKYLGYIVSWSNSVKGGIYYTGGLSHEGNAIANSGYTMTEGSTVGTYTIDELNLDFKLEYKGSDFIYSVKGASSEDSAYLTLYTMSTDDTAPAEALATALQPGTFAAYTDANNRLASQLVKVTIDFSEAELAAIDGCCTPSGITLVEASKSALPMEVGKKINLNDIYFGFDNDTIRKGSDITWSTAESNDIIVKDSAKSITLLGEGVYAATATYGGVEQTVLVFQPEADNTLTIVDYTFSEADAGVTDANGVYTFGGANNDLWKIYATADKTVSYGKLQGGTGTFGTTNYRAYTDAGLNMAGVNYHLVLNPDSSAGKIMSALGDYTITFRATLHPNFVARNYYDLKVAGRYDMTGTAPDFTADTFLGYRAPFNNVNKYGSYYNIGAGETHYKGNAIANSAYVVDNGVINEGDLDFKLQYSGEDLTVWSKGASSEDSAYVQLFTTVGDNSVPETFKNTANQKGTFAVWSKAQEETQLTAQMVKVVVEFTDEEIAEIAKYTTGIVKVDGKNDLVYNATEQQLVSLRYETTDVVEYAVGTDATNAPTTGWSTNVAKATNVGTYYVWYRVQEGSSYSTPACVTVTIAKAQVEKPTAPANTAFTYNAEYQTYAINGESTYTIDGNVQKNAGNYTVTVTLNDTANYEWKDGTTDAVTFPFNIAKKAVTVTADAKSVEMGKTEPALTYVATGLEGSDTLSGALTRETGTTVGTYAILQGTVTNANNPNYDITYVGADFKITKTNQAALVISGQPTGDIVYGDTFTLGVTGGSSTGEISWDITEGASFATVDNAGKVTVTGVGAVKVTATKAGDTNYEPVTVDYTFTSIKATPDIGTVSVSGTVKDTTAPSAVVLVKEKGPDGTLTITDAAMSKTQTSYNWKFTPAVAANYNEITGTVTINVLETTAPTITIKKGTENINAEGQVSFEILSDGDVEITIEYADETNGSGLQDTLYCVANRVLTNAELESAQWTAYNGMFTLGADGKYVVYAKASDKDGNVAVVGSKGIAADATAPEITGVEDDKVYYGDTVVTVADATTGVKEVKVDGDAVTLTDGKFTIVADNAKHTITVTDMLGNETEIEITVNKLFVVKFMDGDKVHATVEVKPGEKVTMPETPKKDGYTAAWDKTVESVTEDTVIKVVYTEIPKVEEPEESAGDAGTAQPESPKTADTTNIWFWAAILVASGAVLLTTRKLKRVK